MRTFNTITNEDLCWRVRRAQKTIVYAAPSLFANLAESIIAFARGTVDDERRVEVFVDANAEVCRLGYGEMAAIEQLMEAGINLRQVEGLRIGVVIIDDEAWIFSPTPQVIEDEPRRNQPNAIAVERHQALTIFRSLDPTLAEEQNKQASLFPEAIPSREIGNKPLITAKVQAEKIDLEMCPPQQFDLARRIRVYSSHLQFVELRLIGCQLQRHTVSIPKMLLNLTGNQETQERLRASYRLIDEKSKFSSRDIELKLNDLRRDLIIPLGERYGNIILRKNKPRLEEALVALQGELQTFREEVKDKLQTEFDQCKNDLENILLPGVIEHPPKKFASRIFGNKPTYEQAKMFLDHELQQIIPAVDSILNEMKLEWLFKDVTYEMLNDNEFQQIIKKNFPYEKWPKLYEETETLGEKLPG